MKIEQNSKSIRKKFRESFLEDKETFKYAHGEFIRSLQECGINYEKWYDSAYMWDLFPNEAKVITMQEALRILREKNGEVFFMSETADVCASSSLNIYGEKYEDFVAKADPVELAERAAYDWYEGARLAMENCYIEDALPEDLYIFDLSFQWVLALTHETDWDEDGTENSADTRLCMLQELNR